MRYGSGMSPKLHIAGVAGLGALLPFVPELVKLVAWPAAVGNAVCAVVLAVAYAITPKKAPK